MIPVMFMLGILLMLITGLGKIGNDSEYYFHSFQNGNGVVVSLIQFILLIYFIYNMFRLWELKIQKVQQFINMFMLTGVAWIFFIPVL